MANVSTTVDPLCQSERVSNASPDVSAIAHAKVHLMRDYRDAKAMAQTLRDGLKTRSINITHSTALELIAKVLGFKDWQVLAARIEADRSAERPPEPSPTPSTVYCSFCGKSQHKVAKIIAGPSVFICDECIDLCDDIVSDQAPEKYIEAQQALPAKSTEELVVLKAKARTSLTRARQLLDAIRAVGRDAGPTVAADELAQSDPRRWFVLRQSPRERAAYAAEVERRISGIQRVGETAAKLLAERGLSLDPAGDRAD
jgi:hypothetical protein